MTEGPWDILIIGSGAGGGSLAFAMSFAGWHVLVLERGPRYQPEDYDYDEIGSALRRDLFVPDVSEDPHVLVDSSRNGVRELTTLGWIASCVGGGTVHMGASLYRFHPDDFDLRSRLGAYEAVEDWPYGYEALEPYYCLAEQHVGIAGAPNPDPLAGHRSRPYPMPPLPRHVLAAEATRACESMGLHPFATPRGINSRPYDGRPPCAECRVCAGRGCPVGAKGSIQATLLRRAEATGRCEVRPRAAAREITVDALGRATGCIYIDAERRERRVRASVVCVSASAVESARLLLLSTSPAWPDGLANGSGLVGRNLQFHVTSGGRGRFRRPVVAGCSPRSFACVSLTDFYRLPVEVSPFAKGAAIGFDRPHRGVGAAAQDIARENGRVLWGAPLKRRLIEYFSESLELEFEAYQDYIPNERTFVTLDGDVRDRNGLPVACLHVGEVAHHQLAGKWLQDRGFEILDGMGAETLTPYSVGGINPFMVHGTCRAGVDPSRSVLNKFCQAHEVPNLFVVDGSFMPTCGGVASTLTIIANSLRTADYILDRARTGALA